MKEQKTVSEGKGKIAEQQVGTKQIMNPSPDPLQLILTKITNLETVKHFFVYKFIVLRLRCLSTKL